MNSVIHKILAFLLAWLKTVAAALWSLVNGSKDASSFSGSGWLIAVAVLLIAACVIDAVIYRKRWHPEWVRLSLRERKKRMKNAAPRGNAPAAYSYNGQQEPYAYGTEMPQTAYDHPGAADSDYRADPPMAQMPAYNAPDPYAADIPIAWDDEPRFDDVPVYTPQPAAPPVYVPEQHPGLNVQSVREMTQPVPAQSGEKYDLRPIADTTAPPSERGLGGLAKRARAFVGFENENDLRDKRIHAVISPQEAFHDPVFPKQDMGGE